MAISREHSKWIKEQKVWKANNRKWLSKHKKKAYQVVTGLMQAINRHNNATKAFDKKIEAARKRIASSNHSGSLHKKLKKVHGQNNQYQAMQEKARKNILRLTKVIQKSIRDIH